MTAALPSHPSFVSHPNLIGRLLDVIDPHTEADRLAVLASLLVGFGSAVGPSPHVLVGAEAHRANLYAVLVGKSSKARKGSSWAPVRLLLEAVDPDWCRGRIVTGLGSGEGLVNVVRDRVERDGEVIDPGELDKRALVLAPEFAAILRVIARQGSTLSPILREGWDRGDLRVTTKNSPMRATGAHVSVLAHVTADELRRELTDTESANGFGNRFIWFGVERSKLLPEPEPFDVDDIRDLAYELRRTLDEARTAGRLERDSHARALWAEWYPVLSRDRYGLAGSLTDRAEAQVLRLSLVYALADRARAIEEAHLVSAIQLWERAERSVVDLFGNATGDPIADRIEAEVARGPLSKTAISGLFGRNVAGPRLDAALRTLVETGRVRRVMVPTGGRSAETYERNETNEERGS